MVTASAIEQAASMTPVEKWQHLLSLVPCVPDAIRDVELLVSWGAGPGKCAMERQVAAFFAQIWTGDSRYGCEMGLPKFDAVEVAARADAHICAVIAMFMQDPFWP